MNHLLSSFLLAFAVTAALPFAAGAADVEKPIGDQTQAWVKLQQSGKQASGAPRPMPGEIADNVYQRYVDSFKQPIPAEFKRQSTGDSGNGSGK
ncbi:MAG: DUF3613 domain-containing protein [Stagnimonas sp.]|nr:DUF3613 domain-containing protein [Stagnimonas sp.]